MILHLGIRVSKCKTKGDASRYPLWGLSQNAGHHDQIQRTICGASSLYYPGEMMMTDVKTVSNEKGFQTFFKRGFWVVDVFNSSCHGLHNMLSYGNMVY